MLVTTMSQKLYRARFENLYSKQECIQWDCSRMRTVRCSLRGEGSVQGVSARGVSARGVSARGVSAQGVSAGKCLPGECVSQHALRQTPPSPVNRMTDRCKNITLPQLRCGR